MITRLVLKESGATAKATNTPELVYELIKPIAKQPQEHFVVIPMDTALHPLGAEVVSIGTIDRTPVSVNVIFKRIFSKKKYATATTFTAAHNHPSGSLEPSPDDWQVTKTLIVAGKLLECTLLDSLILSANGMVSMRRMNSDAFK